jgi:hypothetical protein
MSEVGVPSHDINIAQEYMSGLGQPGLRSGGQGLGLDLSLKALGLDSVKTELIVSLQNTTYTKWINSATIIT